jgi:hypothetical protein
MPFLCFWGQTRLQKQFYIFFLNQAAARARREEEERNAAAARVRRVEDEQAAAAALQLAAEQRAAAVVRLLSVVHNVHDLYHHSLGHISKKNKTKNRTNTHPTVPCD